MRDPHRRPLWPFVLPQLPVGQALYARVPTLRIGLYVFIIHEMIGFTSIFTGRILGNRRGRCLHRPACEQCSPLQQPKSLPCVKGGGSALALTEGLWPCGGKPMYGQGHNPPPPNGGAPFTQGGLFRCAQAFLRTRQIARADMESAPTVCGKLCPARRNSRRCKLFRAGNASPYAVSSPAKHKQPKIPQLKICCGISYFSSNSR